MKYSHIVFSFLVLKKFEIIFTQFYSIFFLPFYICIILNSSKATSNERLEPIRAKFTCNYTHCLDANIPSKNINNVQKKKKKNSIELLRLSIQPFKRINRYTISSQNVIFLSTKFLSKEGRKGRKPDFETKTS